MTALPDYYAILGIRPDADAEVVTAVYRTLVKKFHPDTGKQRGTDSSVRFHQVQEAYEVLGDALKRRAYDETRKGQSAKHSTKGTGTRSGAGNDKAEKSKQSLQIKTNSQLIAIAILIAVCAAVSWLTFTPHGKTMMASLLDRDVASLPRGPDVTGKKDARDVLLDAATVKETKGSLSKEYVRGGSGSSELSKLPKQINDRIIGDSEVSGEVDELLPVEVGPAE